MLNTLLKSDSKAVKNMVENMFCCKRPHHPAVWLTVAIFNEGQSLLIVESRSQTYCSASVPKMLLCLRTEIVLFWDFFFFSYLKCLFQKNWRKTFLK